MSLMGIETVEGDVGWKVESRIAGPHLQWTPGKIADEKRDGGFFSLEDGFGCDSSPL